MGPPSGFQTPIGPATITSYRACFYTLQACLLVFATSSYRMRHVDKFFKERDPELYGIPPCPIQMLCY